MPKFMALLYDRPGESEAIAPQEMQKIIEQYVAWGRRLLESGRLVGSQKLKDGEGRVLRRASGRLRILDGPFAESREIVGGYYAFEASDYDEALRILEDHPHLGYGGTIEVREFDEIG